VASLFTYRRPFEKAKFFSFVRAPERIKQACSRTPSLVDVATEGHGVVWGKGVY
jgi:hypothetical protein